jgi:malate permease and related proteins
VALAIAARPSRQRRAITRTTAPPPVDRAIAYTSPMAVDSFLLILLLLALGKMAARLRMLPDNAAETLNQFALMICLPAAVLRFAPQLQFDASLVGLVAIPWLLLAASALAVYGIAHLMKLGRGERAVLLLCVPLGNTSFLGYPLIEAFLGREGLPYAVIYDQFGSFVILSTWALWVLARYGGDHPPAARDMLLRMVRFPPFIAMLFALTVMPAEPPPVVATLLVRLSDALLPIVALAIGLQLRFRVPRRERAPLAVGLGLKMLLLPALAWPMALAFGLQPIAVQAAVLESAMAPMITAAALAISHRLAPGLAAALVGFGTPLSLLTLPLWLWLLRS